jgi:hypothetical protein
MCSNEDLEQKIASVEDKMIASHTAIAQTISNVGADMKALRLKLETHMDEENENYGKMTREFTDKLDKYVVADMKWKEEYIIADTKFKEDVIAYMTEMLPVKEGLHWVQTLNKFAKWAGLPAIGAMAAYWLVK